MTFKAGTEWEGLNNFLAAPFLIPDLKLTAEKQESKIVLLKFFSALLIVWGLFISVEKSRVLNFLLCAINQNEFLEKTFLVWKCERKLHKNLYVCMASLCTNGSNVFLRSIHFHSFLYSYKGFFHFLTYSKLQVSSIQHLFLT